MNQANDQFMYLGRWVSRKNFRVMVYGKDEKQKLVNSFDEFNTALESGEWFASKPVVVKATRKAKNGSDS